MRLVLLFITFVFYATADDNNKTELTAEEQWEKFKIDFNKIYETPEVEARRKEIFFTNLKEIEGHNNEYKKGNFSYEIGINEYADLNHDEFEEKVHGHHGPTLNPSIWLKSGGISVTEGRNESNPNSASSCSNLLQILLVPCIFIATFRR